MSDVFTIHANNVISYLYFLMLVWAVACSGILLAIFWFGYKRRFYAGTWTAIMGSFFTMIPVFYGLIRKSSAQLVWMGAATIGLAFLILYILSIIALQYERKHPLAK